MVKNTLSKGNIFPYVEEKITPNIGKKLPTNNTNLNNINLTTTNKEKDAAVVAVNFKKIKEKGEEKMQAIREQLMDLDFEKKFIEKLLKDYSLKKIEEKIDLLLIKRNIQNPPAWLIASLKNDYQDPESPSVIASDRRERGNNLKCRGSIHRTRPSYFPLSYEGQGEGDNILSSEEAARRFKLLRHELMAMNSPLQRTNN
jgi:hypothetical protein